MNLRASHPAVPPPDIFDWVLQGQRSRPINVGDISPVSPFGPLMADIFDRGISVNNSVMDSVNQLGRR